MRCQVIARRARLVGRLDYVGRGPVGPDADAEAEVLHRLAGLGGAPLIVNAGTVPAGTLRDSGFWPVMTAATVALLPLNRPAAMRAGLHQKWRNRLHRAEATRLTVLRRLLAREDWLLSAEAAQARARRYRTPPAALALAYANANRGAAQVVEVLSPIGAPLAGVLVLRHGTAATWQTGHVTEAGKRACAMNLALWEAMVWLAEQGCHVLDLGTVNTQDTPGLAHFKLGTGAQAQRLGGSWLHWRGLAPLARRLPLALAA